MAPEQATLLRATNRSTARRAAWHFPVVVFVTCLLSACSDDGRMIATIKNKGTVPTPRLRFTVIGESSVLEPLASGGVATVRLRVKGDTSLRVERWTGTQFIETEWQPDTYACKLMTTELEIVYRDGAFHATHVWTK